MLAESRNRLRNLKGTELLEVADFLCHQSPVVHPIFECVKVFARLHESGNFTYARVPSDLGTQVISAVEISARMKYAKRCSAVLEALELVEKHFTSSWPFSAGSSSWVLLEILHPEIKIAASPNVPTVIFRKAVRLNTRGALSSSPLLERIFRSFRIPDIVNESSWKFDVNPAIQLWNISGEGVYTRLHEQVDGMLHLSEGKDFSEYKGLTEISEKTTTDFIDDLLESNSPTSQSTSLGFYFEWKGEPYQVRGSRFMVKKKVGKRSSEQSPLPIFGIIR
jgi:hypothetical protein